MEATYVIHADDGYIEECFSGSVTLPEVLAFLQRIQQDPAWCTDLDGLADFSHATIDMDYASMLNLASLFETDPNVSHGCWAFVVDNPLNVGMTRMFKSLTEGVHTLRLFNSREAALAWLLGERGA
ncbi:MAG: hypothetical protein GC168_06295 [Candidatus Hydrogenedens sp.]|nr:hypothetical protein [Candidatus Hydrogenedens sp.]